MGAGVGRKLSPLLPARPRWLHWGTAGCTSHPAFGSGNYPRSRTQIPDRPGVPTIPLLSPPPIQRTKITTPSHPHVVGTPSTGGHIMVHFQESPQLLYRKDRGRPRDTLVLWCSGFLGHQNTWDPSFVTQTPTMPHQSLLTPSWGRGTCIQS